MRRIRLPKKHHGDDYDEWASPANNTGDITQLNERVSRKFEARRIGFLPEAERLRPWPK